MEQSKEKKQPPATDTQDHYQNQSIQFADKRPLSQGIKAVQSNSVVQKKANNTGLPDQLKSGIENLSGHSMDDVKVHYNSAKPAQLQAHAYAQGNQIHLGPGQERHLPHEAWHVVQQKQGRVKPTMQLKSKVNINDDVALEREADVMGARALQAKSDKPIQRLSMNSGGDVVQRIHLSQASKISQNRQYRVLRNDSNYLGVKQGAAAPVPHAWITATGRSSYGYQDYTFSHNGFVNDCGQFAQMLVQQHAGQPLNHLLRGQVNGVASNVLFSIPDPTSWNGYTSGSLANNPGFALNHGANPGVGEAFTTIPSGHFPTMTCNYHVAAVVAHDGGDKITCEADAGDANRTEPVFDMYETNVNSQITFHATYRNAYGGVLASTGTLMP